MSGAQIDAGTTPTPTVVVNAPLHPRQIGTSMLTSSAEEQSGRTSPRMGDVTVSGDEKSLEESLFDNAAELKIAFAQIAMHLNPDWRRIVFEQVDRLLGPAHWEDDSARIYKPTFLTFLRFVIYAAPSRFPSLGVSPRGHILAAWLCGPRRISVEFLDGDKAVATFSIPTARSTQIIAWRGHVADLNDFIQRNDLGDCIKN